MKSTRLNLAAVLAASMLAACGGGDSRPAFSSMVSFGDSLSDVGSYKVGTIAAVGGGEYTVNGPTARNWTELVAPELRMAAPCPAQTGLLANIPGFEGAPVANHPECSNYAQGSSRVSNPYTLYAAALQGAPFNEVNLGLMATPLSTQMATHLARAAGAYSGSEVVTVMAGGNDLFMHLNAIASAPAGGPQAVGAALAAGWPAEVQSTVAAGGDAAAAAAVSAGLSGMAQAGAELAALVKTQVLAKGASHVAVLNLPDVSQTPFGMSVDVQTRTLIAGMVTAFNGQLQAGLAGTPVLLLDAFSLSQDFQANPAKYGIGNTTTPACSTTSPANPLQGRSLGCTAASTVVADTGGYLYADEVHPTPLGHRLYARYVIDQMRSAGWL